MWFMLSPLAPLRRAEVVAAGLAGLLFVALWVAVVTGAAPLAAMDRGGADWGAREGAVHPWWVPAWTTASAVLGPVTFRVAAAVAALTAVALGWRGGRRGDAGASAVASTLLFASVTVLVGGLVPVAVKAIVDRPRPAGALVDALQSSFPSSHAFGAATAALVVVTVTKGCLARATHRWLAAVGCALVVLVCVARVALAVHYISDVTAGVCLAVVWVCVARSLWWVLSASSAARA